MKKLLSLLLLFSMALVMQATVYVTGKQINSSTTLDKSNNSSISAGSIKVDYENYVITLTNLTLSSDYNGLEIKGDDTEWWSINVSGTCYITSTYGGKYALNLENVPMAQFHGVKGTNPKLSLRDTAQGSTTADRCAVRIHESMMAFYDLDFEIMSNLNYPVVGSSYAGIIMKGVDGTVSCQGTTRPFYKINSFEMDENSSYVLKPQGVTFDESMKCFVTSSGNPVLGEMTFKLRDYQFLVAGTRVTGRNYNDILGTNNGSSIVRYDPFSKTLELKNATITSDYDVVELTENSTTVSTIDVQGIVRLTSNKRCAIVTSTSPLTIMGHPSTTNELQLKSLGGTDMNAIWALAPVTINVNKVSASSSTGAAIEMMPSKTGDLNIKSTNLTATSASDRSAIVGFSDVKLNSCYLDSPVFGSYSTTKKKYVDQFGIPSTSIQLKNGIGYDLFVGGKRVLYSNKNDVLGDGKVSFDPEYGTLYLNGATISTGTTTDELAGIKSNINLIIDLTGTNNVSVDTWSGVKTFGKNLAILSSSDGILNITAKSNLGLYADKGSRLSILDCVLNATCQSGNSGIGGNPDVPLTIRSAKVTAKGGSGKAPFGMFESITMDGCDLLSPAGAKVGKVNDYYTLVDAAGNQLVGEAEIGSNGYGIWVNCQEVNPSNASDVLGDGTVSYDDATNTLTLNNAHLSGSEKENSLESYRELNIKLIGKNTAGGLIYLWDKNNSAITGKPFTTIYGAEPGASLSITSEHYAITARGGGLTIRDCHIDIEAEYVGIEGEKGAANEVLTIDNASIRIGYASMFGIGNFSQINLLGKSKLLSPWYAEIGNHSQYHASVINNDGSICTGPIVIDTKVTYELVFGNELHVDDDNCADILGDGTVSYDPATNVLTLNNANITTNITANGEMSQALKQIPDNFTVEIKGDNIVTGGIYADYIDWNIQGDGILRVKNESGFSAIGSFHGNLTIKDCFLELSGGRAIYTGDDEGSLTIENAIISAKSTTDAVFCGMDDVILKGCEVLIPLSVHYDTTKRQMVDNFGDPIYEVFISSPYNAIQGVATADSDQPAYNLQGQKVGQQYKGIVVKNGKKVLR